MCVCVCVCVCGSWWWIPELFVDRAQVGLMVLIQVRCEGKAHLWRIPGPSCIRSPHFNNLLGLGNTLQL